ncbi:helix-turn-helix domain-containing protein [Kitasatospora sp. NBC_01266]|uniref:helix-turn-helix domain-containing protein n=1 Tax=Kitasatospora sp. NBC_01266 TaxID=2903572 RepID=UPI002E32B0AB|nr:pyridoxamine 5'-phosphate oxidase family protein [Kitasatospora sp. NBC_01266]
MSHNTPGRSAGTEQVMGEELAELAKRAVGFMTREGMSRSAAIEAARRAVPHGAEHDARTVDLWVDAELPGAGPGGAPSPAPAPHRPGPPPVAPLTDPGDVGRRVALRREELGLSREEAAERAGMAASYLEYLETRPAVLDPGTLLRLAGALDTSEAELLGGGLERPPGRAEPGDRPHLEDLDPADCWARLSDHGVGRLAYATREGPVVLPVNYRVRDGALLYRTAAGSAPSRAPGRRIAFEVDHLDESTSTGWSVLVTGTAEQLFDSDEIGGRSTGPGPEPWAGGTREVWIRVDPERISGRSIRP